jgi:hypothetical protein
VPERAFEDLTILIELVGRGVLSARLGLCLLLIDFSNPVFSPDRAALLRYAPATVAAGNDGAALDQVFIDAVRGGANASSGPEAELLTLWEKDDLLAHARMQLSAFHRALGLKLATPAGMADILDLADSRRETVRRKRSLAEFQSTLVRSEAPPLHLAMRVDGSIFTKTADLGEGEF